MSDFIYGLLTASWALSGLAVIIIAYIAYDELAKHQSYDELTAEERHLIKRSREYD